MIDGTLVIASAMMARNAISAKQLRGAVMDLSHVITEFTFGPYFPDITRLLDNSFEMAYHRKCHAFHCLLALKLNVQYSIRRISLCRAYDYHQGTPGIFFRFNL